MPHPAVSSDRPLVFAHRGGAALSPENTIAAFDRALACGADGLELDVRLSRDGIVVVLHDARLDRTTDATGPAARWTASELGRVDAGARFGLAIGAPYRGRGIGVPTLAEVLARYPATRLIVELKENTDRLARAVVGDVMQAGAEDRVCLGSFGHRALGAIRRLAPTLATGASRAEVRVAHYRSRLGWPVSRPAYQAFQVPERSGRTLIVTPRFLAAARRADVVVQVWTVDDPADIRRLLASGVAAIITDRPDVAVTTVRGAIEENARS